MKLFLAVFVVNGREQHAAGVDAHHRARRQIGDSDAGLADQLLRLVILMNAAQNDAVLAGSVIQNELQELLGLLHRFAFLDLHSAEIALGEGLKINEILEQRLDLHVREVDFFLRLGSCLSSLRLNRSRLFSLLVGVQRLHCREIMT